ncbi:hypothetical protein FJU31_12895 [Stenotrophomonas cyclobalanopsidis]|uniref:GNAT family N-acetyltransferase n=2 Tax=Stenotrophomonas cyclobalanopsidis TaxID=2771362 RepID=A0ABQ6SZ47_9GAMM|nr:hypothetical protein FJU31_12895 [Stenotrophomonas cyclobalanopsidis]
MTMTPIDAEWLEDFDHALLSLFATTRREAGINAYLLGCYADLEPREAAMAYGNDYDLARTPLLWPMPGLVLHS